ncbi:MAG: MBL fold metallo-hydrolase [Chloroflexota bacterium]|nr:MBL fold metallo-hydrolase [Chloroflexota bacterium]MDE2947020.1 MBL fold metallo-hydrolase [Chloroflexota bacterium]
MSIKIKSLTLGPFATNAYLVADTQTSNAILIDPVDDAPAILRAAEAEGWTIKLMLATHAHLDHVLASGEIKRQLQIPFLIHEDCETLLDEIPLQGLYFGLGELPAAAEPDRLLTSDSEVVELDSIRLESLYTPGHAPGHLSFYLAEQKILFSGDSLFAGSIGRTDLPGGDHQLLMQSIFEQLMVLDDDVQVLPGHMGVTTIGRERLTNPFILSYNS